MKDVRFFEGQPSLLARYMLVIFGVIVEVGTDTHFTLSQIGCTACWEQLEGDSPLCLHLQVGKYKHKCKHTNQWKWKFWNVVYIVLAIFFYIYKLIPVCKYIYLLHYHIYFLISLSVYKSIKIWLSFLLFIVR